MPDPAEGAEPLALELLDTPIGPIDDVDEPKKEPSSAREVLRHLRQLEFASPWKEQLEKRNYGKVAEALDKEQQTVDEANNLGCARAWLACRDCEVSSWESAIAALSTAVDLPGSREARKRAQANLDRVLGAWDAMAAPA